MTDASAHKETISGVFSRAADTYSRTGWDFFVPAGRRLVECAGLTAGERVLDVGAGAGACTIPAAEAVGPAGSVRAVDLADGMVQRLRRTTGERGLSHVEVLSGDAEDPPVEAGSVDVIVAGFLLFFLPDLDGALRRYVAALRQGGRLAASWFGPDDQRWNAVHRAIAAHIPEAQRPKDRRVPESFDSVATLERTLTVAGFTDVRTVEEPFTLDFPDAAAWYAWSWSHGLRAIWEAVPADRLDAARDQAQQAIRTQFGDRDRPEIQFQFRYTVARTPTDQRRTSPRTVAARDEAT